MFLGSSKAKNFNEGALKIYVECELDNINFRFVKLEYCIMKPQEVSTREEKYEKHKSKFRRGKTIF